MEPIRIGLVAERGALAAGAVSTINSTVWLLGGLLVLVASDAQPVGGGLGSGLESDEAVRAAAYSKREEDRRNRLADSQG